MHEMSDPDDLAWLSVHGADSSIRAGAKSKLRGKGFSSVRRRYRAHAIQQGYNQKFSPWFATADGARRWATTHFRGLDWDVDSREHAVRGGSSSRSKSSSRSSAGYCSKCRGPHVYKHGKK